MLPSACVKCGSPADRTSMVEVGLYKFSEVPMCGPCYSRYIPVYRKGKVEFRRRRIVNITPLKIVYMVEVRGAEKLVERLGKRLGGPIVKISAVSIFITLFVTAFVLCATAIYALHPEMVHRARDLWASLPTGYGLTIIPGIDPFLPLLQGWIALTIAVAVHELGHGLAAAKLGYTIRSIGLIFVGPIPIGAGVDVDGGRPSDRVYGAGIVMNIMVALMALTLLLLLANPGIGNPVLLLIPPEISRLHGYELALGPITSILFYIWLVNIMLALANAAPLLITDGSYLLLSLLERAGAQNPARITTIISCLVITAALAAALVQRIPWA